MELIHLAGFGGVLKCLYEKVDNHLITALVERWRPETHTFHFPLGEVTITIQDVQVLWGLPITDNLVSGSDESQVFLVQQNFCEQFLGFTPINDVDVKLQDFFLTRLETKIETDWPSDDTTNLHFEQIARCIILHLIGGTVFPTKKANTISFHLFKHVEHLGQCGKLSWASATLASLYKNLCTAINPLAKNIVSACSLLQLWVWERIKRVAPKITHDYLFIHSLGVFDGPYGGRFRGTLSWSGVPKANVLEFRSVFQSMTHVEFAWTPYENILQYIKPEYLIGRDSWLCETFLIYYETVEPHIPSRVMRQFGRVQERPVLDIITVEECEKLHKINRNATKKYWLRFHRSYVWRWLHRLQSIKDSPSCYGNFQASSDYMNWYIKNTMYFVRNSSTHRGSTSRDGNLGARVEILGQGMGEIWRVASQGNTTQDDPRPSMEDQLAAVRGLTQQYAGYAGVGYNFEYQTSHLSSQETPYGCDDFESVCLILSWMNMKDFIEESGLMAIASVCTSQGMWMSRMK